MPMCESSIGSTLDVPTFDGFVRIQFIRYHDSNVNREVGPSGLLNERVPRIAFYCF